jgi:hypothetical protein
MKFVAPTLLAAGCLLAAPAPAAPVSKAGPPRVLTVAANHLGNWDIFLLYSDTGDVKNLTRHRAADMGAA